MFKAKWTPFVWFQILGGIGMQQQKKGVSSECINWKRYLFICIFCVCVGAHKLFKLRLCSCTQHVALTNVFQYDTWCLQLAFASLTYRRWGDKTSYLKNFKCSEEPKNMAALTL